MGVNIVAYSCQQMILSVFFNLNHSYGCFMVSPSVSFAFPLSNKEADMISHNLVIFGYFLWKMPLSTFCPFYYCVDDSFD